MSSDLITKTYGEGANRVGFTDGSSIGESEVDDLALKWLALDLRARLVVDRDLRILWSNANAAASLAEKRDVQDRKGSLTTVNRGLQRQLETFVGSCTGKLASWNLPRGDGDGSLIIRAQRLNKESNGHCTYGLLFFGGGSDFKARYSELDTIFKLTASEYRVLLQMIAGHDANGVAAKLDVSIDTVRSHIRGIYAKVGATSREELFSKLRPHRL